MGTDVKKYKSVIVVTTAGTNEYRDCQMTGNEDYLLLSWEHRNKHYVATFNKNHVIATEVCIDASRWEN